MKRAAVTGAGGFVGANLVRRLLRDGHEVHALVRPGRGAWRLEGVREDISLHGVDIGEREAVARAISDARPDWVFHLAVHGAYPAQTDVRAMVQTNLVGTINLVEACLRAGVGAIVNTGSSSEYGYKDHAPREEEWVDPNSHYAVTKVSATLFCRYSARRHGLHLPTLRLYSAYGPYEEPTRLMPTLVARGLQGALPPLASPDIARDYVYIDDVCEAYILAATRPPCEAGSVYNVGTGKQTTLSEVVEVARRTMQIRSEPEWGTMADRAWDTTVWVADNRKIERELGWRPGMSFAEGFERMVAWFRESEEVVSRHYTPVTQKR